MACKQRVRVPEMSRWNGARGAASSWPALPDWVRAGFLPGLALTGDNQSQEHEHEHYITQNIAGKQMIQKLMKGGEMCK